MPSAHAKFFGASSSKKWLTCPASIQREAGRPNKSSNDALWGTACHYISEQVLLGLVESQSQYLDAALIFDGSEVIVDAEMIECSKVYTDFVRHLVETTGGALSVEQRLDYRRWLAAGIDEDDGFGTGDAVIVAAAQKELLIVDLKAGAGVDVSAEGNTQLRLYALGAYNAQQDNIDLGLLDIEQVRMVIVQPRSGGIKEEVIGIDELFKFGEHARWCSQRIVDAVTLGEQLPASVSEEGCRWCKAKADCPDLQADVLKTVFGDFDDLTTADVIAPETSQLPVIWLKRDLIRGFMSAVEERMLEETRSGSFPDYKIVEGRKGNRSWQSVEQAEAEMKSMRLKHDQMYDYKLISPTTAEKVLKEKPRSWTRLKKLIVQPGGKDTVAPISDPRPAKASVTDDFDDCSTPVTATADADLF